MTEEIHKFGVYLPIAVEARISDGRRAELARQREVRLAETKAWLDGLASIHSPLVRKLLELHQPVGGICDGCDWLGHECEQPEWPCRTVQLIAKHFGRPAPEWVEFEGIHR